MSQSCFAPDTRVRSFFDDQGSKPPIDLSLRCPSNNKHPAFSGWFQSNQSDRHSNSSPKPGWYRPSSTTSSTPVPSLASSGDSVIYTGPSTPPLPLITERTTVRLDIGNSSTDGFQPSGKSRDTSPQRGHELIPSSLSNRSSSAYSSTPSFSYNEPPQTSMQQRNRYKSPQQLDHDSILRGLQSTSPSTAFEASNASGRYVAPRSDVPSSSSYSPFPDFEDDASRVSLYTFSKSSIALPTGQRESFPVSPSLTRSSRANTGLGRERATIGRGPGASTPTSSVNACAPSASADTTQSNDACSTSGLALDPHSEYCERIRAREAEPDSTVAGVGSERVLPSRSEPSRRTAKLCGDTNPGYRRLYDRIKSRLDGSIAIPSITVDEVDEQSKAAWERIEKAVADEDVRRRQSRASGSSRCKSIKSKITSKIPSQVKSFFKSLSGTRGERWRSSNRVNSNPSHDPETDSPIKTLQRFSSSSHSNPSEVSSSSFSRGVGYPARTLMQDEDLLGGGFSMNVSDFGGC
ncbi:hypothetical protein I302_100342 [Kwoniella bestiolae CBS 10118]|uniref:Uncharacterized protein n=1 Tax=Kwoniella bestiolae CBS 10118 TaxID=1296100 RepID=A0A1B9G4R7_9TREE|nr:hypothetical protein I302_03714 [Kwoniella bestiolae CBS 10118]OCF26037.1 hypothetical protein I302_03714 [Kwoniella bestiolae CBS 10118]